MRPPEIRTLPGAEFELPARVARLQDLAYNLWWTWTPRANLLFSTIDPKTWIRSRNPVELLTTVEPHVWDDLLISESFMSEYHAVVDELDRYVKGLDTAWFRRSYPEFEIGPVAYLSTEFGWHECLGIYSGGLGVLSGDHCKSASDLGLPFVGVGLMYRRGYFRQTVDANGRQQHFYPDFDLRRLPVLPVAGPGNKPLKVGVELPGRTVQVRAWKATIGRVPVLLLDTDLRENDPADRPITSILYVAGREMRLCQETVLGIGGVRMLRALGIEPSVWHLNEGHSALANFERIREFVSKESIPFAEARERAAKTSVFTTHTPVPAGNETFDAGLVGRYVAAWAGSNGVLPGPYVDLGRASPEGNDPVFNMTILAIRTSSKANGVSRLHGKVAESMWKFLWPDASSPRIGAITNGVHTPSWVGPELGELLRRHLGRDFVFDLQDPGFAEAVLAIPDADFFGAHQAQKRRLITLTREAVLSQFARHGRSPDELRTMQTILREDVLTLGFARRFATYKRADLLFRDPARLRAIVADADRPVQVLFAGKAHPADRPGQELIRTIFEASLTPELTGRIVYLENYDMRIARFLVQGVDVWVNTPRRPLEASGTSGMKAAANGVLNFSVLDGWWAEAHEPENGWAIGDGTETGDEGAQDREDAASLYRTLADEIVPLYYDRDPASGLPARWIGRMKRSLGTLAPRFSTDRMVRDYAVKAYVPAARGVGSEIDEATYWSP